MWAHESSQHGNVPPIAVIGEEIPRRIVPFMLRAAGEINDALDCDTPMYDIRIPRRQFRFDGTPVPYDRTVVVMTGTYLGESDFALGRLADKVISIMKDFEGVDEEILWQYFGLNDTETQKQTFWPHSSAA